MTPTGSDPTTTAEGPAPLGPEAALRIETLSDWHVGSGSSAPGAVHALVRRDADGLPYLPGTTVTGVFRESCRQVAAALDGETPGRWSSWLRYLFGNRSSDANTTYAPAHLGVRAARLSGPLRARLRRSQALLDATTFVKPGVAIDQATGRASDHHVRFVEMARAGMVLTAPLELTGELRGEHRVAATVLLTLGAAWMRSLGGSRRRGSGDVRVTLTARDTPDWDQQRDACVAWAHQHTPPEPPPRAAEQAGLNLGGTATVDTGEWVEIPLEFTTVDPVRCTRVTVGNVVHGYAFLPGTNLLPWVLRTLGSPGVLRRALVAGRAVLTHATPVHDTAAHGTAAQGSTRCLPTPAALGASKHAEGGTRYNRLHESNRTPDLRGDRSGWIAPAPGTAAEPPTVLERDTRFVTHNVVTENSGRPTIDDGGVFTVEVIPAGTTLRGSLRLDPSVCAEVDAELGAGWERTLGRFARLGRASKSEYGRAEVRIGDRTTVRTPEASSELTVWALSDVLVRDARLRLSGQVHDVVAALERSLDVSLRLLAAESRHARVESWQSSWGLPRPSLVGLAAGSCLRLEVTSGSVDPGALHTLTATGIGERRGEGFGQLELNHPLLARDTVEVTQPASRAVSESITDTPDATGPDSASEHELFRVVWRRAMRDLLEERVPRDTPRELRTRLKDALEGVSRSQRGQLRELVRDLGSPNAEKRLDAYIERRDSRAATTKLITILGTLRDTRANTNPLRTVVDTAAGELGQEQPGTPAGTDMLPEALGLLILDVLTEIDTKRGAPEDGQDDAASSGATEAAGAPAAPAQDQSTRDRRASTDVARKTATGRRAGSGSQSPQKERAEYRTVRQRWELAATLVARTPLHVGGAHDDPYLDLTVARDGCGRPYVPGTSLAGVLRGWWRRHHGDAGESDVWSGAKRRGHGDEPLASLITVADAPLSARDGGAPHVGLRDGVGIDRRRGAAAPRVKYEREVIPAGTRLRLRLIAEDVASGENSVLGESLRGLREALESEGLALGAGTSRGLGRLVTATGTVDLVRDDLRGPRGILDAIGRGPATAKPDLGATVEALDHPGDGILRFRIDWRPDGPLLVGGGEGADGQYLPLMDQHPDTGDPVPVLPGSSVKGVLRAEVERALRTHLDLPGSGPDFTAALRAVAEACPPFAALFGSQDRKAALSIPDTYARAPEGLTSQRWNAYVNAGESQPVAGWAEATHVAIDRWSGGAADGMLYTVLEPHDLRWGSLLLDVDTRMLGAGKQARAAVTLLLYAVANLAGGTVPIGHGGHRGSGGVLVERVEPRHAGLDTGWPDAWTGEPLTLAGDGRARRSAVLGLAASAWDGDSEPWTTYLREQENA